jgi:hypothetical protein
MFQFTFDEITRIAARLGLENTYGRVWEGIDSTGNYLKAVIHSYVGGPNVPKPIISSQVEPLGFKSVEDMYDFLNDKKRKR